MNSYRVITVIRWMLAFAGLGVIVLVYRRWLHVNTTTVALTLLLLILVLAAEWGLRMAVVISLAATALYNFYFLPPIGTFTVADPQNWLTLFVFLSTSIIASRLSERARDEAADARAGERELEVLFRLSRELLQSDSVATLVSAVPGAVASVTGATSASLYLLQGDRLYQAGVESVSETEIPHLRQLANTLAGARVDGGEMDVPVRTGVRPRGLLALRGVNLSLRTADAIGSLVATSMERAKALESIARNDAAKESERLRTLMIDSITHELRTPLTSIKGAASTLLAEELSREGTRDLLTVIDEESDRLNQLVSEAVEMAQLDAHQVQMHFGLVAVDELIRDSLETCAWVKEQHPVRVEIADGLSVRADPVVLQKVFCNLLENAAKYSKAGSAILVSAEKKGEEVRINVADRGFGIDPSEQSLIFERFYRARGQAGGVSGTGMGLAISRAITEAHGGKIEVTSQPGQGSVFTVRLPVGES